MAPASNGRCLCGHLLSEHCPKSPRTLFGYPMFVEGVQLFDEAHCLGGTDCQCEEFAIDDGTCEDCGQPVNNADMDLHVCDGGAEVFRADD